MLNISINWRGERAFMQTTKIAIDGPSGAGKSTIAKIAAKHLGYIYIDTGAMYRAVALKALRNNIDTKDDIVGVGKILKEINIDIQHNSDGQIIFLDGEDVSALIRTPEVSIGASNVSAMQEVRLKLVDLQRKLAENHNVIMDGRDIGTYVLPDANVKIFLTATLEDRAKRRYDELILKGIECQYEDVKKDMEYRDLNDSSRAFAPLKPADDATILDTTGNELEKSVELVLNVIKERLK